MVEMLQTSFLRISTSGFARSRAGLDKDSKLVDQPDFLSVLGWTVVWTTTLVTVTVVPST
ncbi:hypothetical protein [Kitasatospora sp. NPDC057015]|uniref:hypothetical protein n=1 Tax=Kitasatospora sp. NPDC057015 TaxID=3346001 RepID=UPI00363F4F39